MSIYEHNYIFVYFFCVLWHYLNLLILGFFSLDLQGFYYVGNKSYPLQIGILLFLCFWFLCFLFSCLLSLAEISCTVLNKSSENGHPCLIPHLRGRLSAFQGIGSLHRICRIYVWKVIHRIPLLFIWCL